jgi:hypothetical protein
MVGQGLYVLEQQKTRNRLAFKINREFARLDLRDLDASWPTYLEATGYDIHTEWSVSVLDALNYLFDLLLQANNPPAAPLLRPVFKPSHVRDFLWLTGPGRIKQLIDAGWDQQAAFLSAQRAAVLASQNHVTQEARQATQEAAEDAEDYDGRSLVQGYLRIARPTACAFCRRLAGATQKIGLVYNVTTKWRTPHVNCKCEIQPQPVYRLMHVQSPEQLALTAQMYADIRREADEARWQAQRDLIAA